MGGVAERKSELVSCGRCRTFTTRPAEAGLRFRNPRFLTLAGSLFSNTENYRFPALSKVQVLLTKIKNSITQSDVTLTWWAVQDLNLRPSRCKRDALPAELTALISYAQAQ